MAFRSRYGVSMLLVTLVIGCTSGIFSTGTPRMAKDVLKAKIDGGSQENLTVLDVRFEEQWEKSAYKIKGAIRENPSDFKSWMGKYPKNRLLVLYCA